MSSNPAGGGLRMRDVRTGGMMGRSKDVVWDRWEERRREERKIYWLGVRTTAEGNQWKARAT
jgi:hypothetical protein